MRYKDHILITRAAQTPDGQGGFADSTTTTLYDARCDAQEILATHTGGINGQLYEGECVVFLPCSLATLNLENGDAVTITFDGGEEREGSIAKRIRLDDSLDIRYK